MCNFLKYFSLLNLILIMGFTHTVKGASTPSLNKKIIAQKSRTVTVLSFKTWVNNIKHQLKLPSNKSQKSNNLLLEKINQQLKGMKASSVVKKNSLKGKNSFLLHFQLASFQELFPLLLSIEKSKNKKNDCAYLKQKIIYDIYPNYEDIKNSKLPYAHTELKEILQIICTQ